MELNIYASLSADNQECKQLEKSFRRVQDCLWFYKISHNILTILENIDYTFFISFNESGKKAKFPLIMLVPNNLLEIIDKLENNTEIFSERFETNLSKEEFINKLKFR